MSKQKSLVHIELIKAVMAYHQMKIAKHRYKVAKWEAKL